MNKLNHSANHRELGSRFSPQKSNQLRVSTVRPPSCFVCCRESTVAKISFAVAYNIMLMSRQSSLGHKLVMLMLMLMLMS